MNLPATNLSTAPGSRQALVIPLAFTGVFMTLGLLLHGHHPRSLDHTFVGVTLFLLAWQGMLFLRSAGKGFAWEFVPVRSHYVQAMVQFSIYAYWGWYWRNVYAEAPLILSQIVFLYAFDALLTWSRGQTWRLGFGPWPIVFSTNLFMWFHDDYYVFQFLMVALGVMGKQFVRWPRDGKITHIFNPSAFALTIVSLILIFSGNTDHTWGEQIAITQGRPPHLYTEIFICGLIVQYFFSVTLMTFAAAATLGLLTVVYTRMTGTYMFFDSNIPIAVFLGLHLLMTDPATTPRSSLGRIMFGSLYGLGVWWAFIILTALGLPSFYDKLVVVPLLNLLTPVLDRVAALGLAGKFGRWELSVGPRKMNLAFMSGWAALFLTMLATGFVEAPHPGASIEFWKQAAEANRPHAVEHLRVLLNDFDRQDIDQPAELVRSTDGNAGQSRDQLMGILCNEVASIYAEGKWVPADPNKAARYFKQACDLGNIDGCANVAREFFRTNAAITAMDARQALGKLENNPVATNNGRMCYLIGFAYDNGRGRDGDKAKARQFYEMGANLGDLAAGENLARMQLDGEGGPVDHTAAAQWLQKAADSGDGMSCLYLARLYHTGDGVPHDEQQAMALLEKAANLGVEPARMLLQQMHPAGGSQ
jgi:hypothetical protein